MKVFTTGQVAKICKVAPKTVARWFDSGRLKGYRIPGTNDRRFTREFLIRFIKEHGMPLGDLENEVMIKVLIVSEDQVLIDSLRGALTPEQSFLAATAAGGFEAGTQAEVFRPDCIVIDYAIGKSETLKICQQLRRNAKYSEVTVIVLLSGAGDDVICDPDDLGINEIVWKPFSPVMLVNRIMAFVEAKK